MPKTNLLRSASSHDWQCNAAKTATGAEPVLAYVASLQHPQGGMAERIALAAKTLLGIQREVKLAWLTTGSTGEWFTNHGGKTAAIQVCFGR